VIGDVEDASFFFPFSPFFFEVMQSFVSVMVQSNSNERSYLSVAKGYYHLDDDHGGGDQLQKTFFRACVTLHFASSKVASSEAI